MPNKHKLTDQQTGMLRSADGNRIRAMLRLGEAHLRHLQAKALLEQAQAELRECERTARDAEAHKVRVMDQIAKELDLSDGQYVYDQDVNALVGGE